MRLPLKRHYSSPCPAVTQIEVEVARPAPDRLMLSYAVTGDISDICLPARVKPVRADRLWQHTCFEAFVGASTDAGYYEFNFSPSTCWAAYRFTGYRTGMQPVAELAAPRIAVQAGPHGLTLQAVLEFAHLPDVRAAAAWRLALSAVIEDTAGCRTYWALAHPPGEPDFHHADCFAHTCAPA